jgi:hypothetical protein
MNQSSLCALACLLICSLAFASLAQVGQSDLTAVLQQASNRRQEYIETFKDLTAAETKTTELFDKSGKIEKQRKVVSDFLVYPLQTRTCAVDEIRITREVDGKPVGKGEKQAIELFQKLANSKNSEQEVKRLRDENLKYTLKYYRWGITLQPVTALAKEAQPGHSFEIAGQESLGGRKVILLKYQLNEVSPSTSNLVRTFTNPRVGKRGRIWLDAENFRVWRWENEYTVVDRDITSAAVYMRDEIEYVSSAFGILVPKTIVTSFFDKSEPDKRSLRLTGRITYNYDAFKRFDVSAESEVPKLRN